MKAAINTRYGPPEIVRIMEVPRPVPKNNEVLIKVQVATVNRTDCGFRSAEYFISRFFSGLFKPKNKTLGNEFAGIVEEVGESVRTFKPGARVFGYNDLTFGAHAQYRVMPESGAITTMPDNFSFEQAAPFTEGAHYALCNIRASKIKKGQHILVYGATGAIGSAAVQLAKHFGVRVTAVCNSQNVALVKSLGADEVLDYTKQDYTQTSNRYHFVFDAVGKTSFGTCKPVLTENGIYISTELGKNSENVFLALISPFSKGKKVLFPIPTSNKDDVEFLKSLGERGELKPVVDRSYPMSQIVEAYKYVESGQKTGNVLLTIN